MKPPRQRLLRARPSTTGVARTSPVRERRRRQVIESVSHYLIELRQLRTPRELFDWTYYKMPRLFSLRDFPTELTLEFTNECNFACPHCPRTELNKARDIGFMSMSLLRKIAQESSGRVANVKIAGLGEPALHPDLSDMLSCLREHGLRTTIYTNGTLFQRYTYVQISQWRLWRIVVSVDGMDAKTFRRLRVGGDYETVRRGVAEFRRLRDARNQRSPLIEIRHVIMPSETHVQLRAFKEDWTGGLGDTVKFNYLEPLYGAHRREDPSRSPCRDIRRETFVRYDGRVPLCGYNGHREWIGDVRRNSLRQVWHSPRLNEVRRCHQEGDLSELSFCRTCTHR